MAVREEEIQTIKQRFGIVGNSPALIYAIQVAVQVAPTDMSVLITGESGSGKESFSKIIHSLSHRKHGQFIAINLKEPSIRSYLGTKKALLPAPTGPAKVTLR